MGQAFLFTGKDICRFTHARAMLLLAVAVAGSACGRTTVDSLVEGQVSGSIQATFWVRQVAPSMAKPGQTVTLQGFGLGDVTASVANVPATTAPSAIGDLMVITIPDGVSGVTQIKLHRGEETTALPFVVLGADGNATIATDSSAVCVGEPFMTPDGAALVGSKPCGAAEVKECTAEGQTGCVASTSYPAVDTKTLPSRVIQGAAVAGINGKAATPPPPFCVNDGEKDCVTNAAFPAAKRSAFSSADIRDGKTIAGVVGNLPTTMPPGCTTNFESACIATSDYPAVDRINLTADNIKRDVVIAGLTGTYPSATNPLAGDTVTTDLPNLSASVAAGSYEWFTAAGEHKTGSIADAGSIAIDGNSKSFNASVYRQFNIPGDAELTAANIRTGVEIYGKTGTMLEKPADCTSNFAINCVATNSYKAISPTNLTAENIKKNVAVAGLTGTYPSADNLLATASATADLTSLASTVAAGAYEWFGPDGTRYTGSIADAGTLQVSTVNQVFNTSVYRSFTVQGEPNLTVANVRNGVQIGAVTGLYPSASNRLAGATGTTDLGSIATGVSAGNYEWYESDGTRRTGNFVDAGTITPGQTNQSFGNQVYASFTVAGDADLKANNIRSGQNLFGFAGTYTDAPPACNEFGVGSCVVDGINFKAASAYAKSVNYIDVTSPQVPLWLSTAGNVAIGFDVTYSSTPNASEVRLYRKNSPGGCSGEPTSNGWSLLESSIPRTVTSKSYSFAAGSWYVCAAYLEQPAFLGSLFFVSYDVSARIDVAQVPGSCQSVSGSWTQGPFGCRKSSAGAAQHLNWSVGTTERMNWFTAHAYCRNLTEVGVTGWRLPTMAEMQDAHTAGGTTFLRAATDFHWSADDSTVMPATHAQDFNFGTGLSGDISRTGLTSYAICVRAP